MRCAGGTFGLLHGIGEIIEWVTAFMTLPFMLVPLWIAVARGLRGLGDRRPRHQVEAVERARPDVKFGRHPGAIEPRGIVDVFVDEQIERGGRDEGRSRGGGDTPGRGHPKPAHRERRGERVGRWRLE